MIGNQARVVWPMERCWVTGLDSKELVLLVSNANSFDVGGKSNVSVNLEKFIVKLK
jgi:hypothetical protein